VKHFLVYHSAEKMEHSFRDDEEGEGSGIYSIVTSKKPDKLKGTVIWLISGEGKPRDYRLEYWFIVDGFKTITDPEFRAEVYGAEGYTFSGGVRIGALPWFRPFRERMANFSLGLSSLTDSEVNNFTAAATAAKGKLPA
jgi:hypothetical protein